MVSPLSDEQQGQIIRLITDPDDDCVHNFEPLFSYLAVILDPPEPPESTLAAVLAEVEHWKAHAEEAGRGFARVCRDAARISARNVALVDHVAQLEADLAAAEAKLAAVEALADDWVGQGIHRTACADMVRAALAT